MNFQNTVVELGRFKQFTQHEAIFYKTPECLPIASVQGVCQCTTPVNNLDSVSSIYHAGQIAEQVIGDQYIQKRIIVKYENGSEEALTITGTLTR